MNQLNSSQDIVIIGGGIVGLAAACLLAKAGFSVIIIEGGKPPENLHLNEYDLRVSAITKFSQKILQHLETWDEILSLRATPFRSIIATNTHSGNQIRFDSTDVAETELGFIIENSILRTVLWKKLNSFQNAKIITQVKLTAIKQHANNIELILDNHSSIFSKLLIGADGAKSQVRQLANIALTEKNYHQSAIVATIKTSLPHHEIARQRFLEGGPLAFLPLSQPDLCSIVWSIPPEQASMLCNLSVDEFNQTLAKSFNYELGRTELQSERAAFPLIMRHANSYVTTRIALIGDAAHTLHPLAGQGLNLGLQDASALIEILVTTAQKNRDIGHLSNLRKYERSQKSHNAQMISLVGGFNWVFNQSPPWLKNWLPWGMNFFDQIPFLKQWTMRQAMGLTTNNLLSKP